MRRTLTTCVLALVLAVSALPGMAKTKRTKRNPERIAAVKKCEDDYKAAVADAKTRKGKERADALSAARKSRKDCLAAAPN